MNWNFWKRSRKDKVLCSLDIGASSLKASLLKAQGENAFEVLGVCEMPIYGFKEAFVTDLAEFSESINRIIDRLSEKSHVRIQDLQIGISSPLVEMRESAAMIPLLDRGSKVIMSRDIKKVNEHARLLGLKMDEEILHEIVQAYQADDVSLGLNPVGLYGRKLGVQTLLMLTNVNKIRNIMKAINQIGYDIDNLFYSSYASSVIVLNDKEKNDGCVLVDIGTYTTSVFVFRQKTLKHSGNIPMGGHFFTQGIAEALNIPYALAEQIKRNHAEVIKSPERLEEDVLIKRESAYMPIKRSVLYNAMENSLEILLNGITDIIKASGYREQINCGITVVGGGALLNGLMERIAQSNNTTVKLGHLQIKTQEKFINSMVYAPAVGIAICGYQKNHRQKLFPVSSNGWKKDLMNKMMELYQEYF
jgi:cell division protein FtsA